MMERIGPAALKERFEREATQWAQTLPQIPRLVHAALARHSAPGADEDVPAWAQALVAETRRSRRWLKLLAGAASVLAAVAVAFLALVLIERA